MVQYIARSAVGVFVRLPRGDSMENLARELRLWLQRLSKELGAPPGGQISFLSQSLSIDAPNRGNWYRMVGWLGERTRAYQAAFERVLGEPG